MSRRSRKSKRKLKSLFMMTVLMGMLLLSSTYAWFSATREVELDGINAKVVAAEGLQISLDGEKWSSKIAINPTALAGATGNKYQWPAALTPVSTNGDVDASGGLKLYGGDMTNDGKDLSSASLETDGNRVSSGKYIAFDVYFKNSSSNSNDSSDKQIESDVGGYFHTSGCIILFTRRQNFA